MVTDAADLAIFLDPYELSNVAVMEMLQCLIRLKCILVILSFAFTAI